MFTLYGLDPGLKQNRNIVSIISIQFFAQARLPHCPAIVTRTSTFVNEKKKKTKKKDLTSPHERLKAEKKKEIGILGAFFLDKKKRGAFAPLLCCPSSVRQIELAHGDQRIEIRIDLQAVQGAVLQDIGRPELRGHDLAHPIVAA